LHASKIQQNNGLMPEPYDPHRLLPTDVPALLADPAACEQLARSYGVSVETLRLALLGIPLSRALGAFNAPNAGRLNPEDVRAIRSSPEPSARLAARYGVTWQTIYNIRQSKQADDAPGTL
jgi:hypothetical protein